MDIRRQFVRYLFGLLRQILHKRNGDPNFINSLRGRIVQVGGNWYDVAAKGGTVVHCGIFQTGSLDKWVDAIGPRGQLIAVEGEPANFERLKAYVEERGLSNVTVIHSAVWSKVAEVTFQTSANPHFNKLKDSHTHSDAEAKADFQEHSVVAKPLDDILAQLGVTHVDQITLTISGAELVALDGMKKTLSQPGLFLIARSILLDDDNKPMYPKVAAKLRQMGLKAYHGGPEKHPPRDGCNVFAFCPK